MYGFDKIFTNDGYYNFDPLVEFLFMVEISQG
jgi:hypothetical protein